MKMTFLLVNLCLRHTEVLQGIPQSLSPSASNAPRSTKRASARVPPSISPTRLIAYQGAFPCLLTLSLVRPRRRRKPSAASLEFGYAVHSPWKAPGGNRATTRLATHMVPLGRCGSVTSFSDQKLDLAAEAAAVGARRVICYICFVRL